MAREYDYIIIGAGSGGCVSKLHRSKHDWKLWTEPQDHVDNRKLYLPRGKTLGGCSSTNALAYVRGNKDDYNDWASMGCDGWDYDHVLPYFIKSEGNADVTKLDNGYHSDKGAQKTEHCCSLP